MGSFIRSMGAAVSALGAMFVGASEADADLPVYHAVLVGQETSDVIEVISRVNSEMDFEVESKIEADMWRLPGPLVNASGLPIGTGSFSNQPLQAPQSMLAIDVDNALGQGDALQNQAAAMKLFQDLRDSSILLNQPVAQSTPGPGAAAIIFAPLLIGARRRN